MSNLSREELDKIIREKKDQGTLIEKALTVQRPSASLIQSSRENAQNKDKKGNDSGSKKG
ncbi:hypothetical protein [Sphingobacterium sp. IITKGP-BTPF85]|uniref:hypothetical protein n=1 Tax=Sphingobacterium sp. IITKGP-BTPF85 TaxID=1338009 RepID=UPI00038A4671|nr:hypothetical protein [Sphingobacterium sp. IITKGP-BTPF85]KKX47286.1 hypothetical protein L950_0227310 [Sphingobacterium sp. IITKGP-BTPF85]